MIFELQGEGLTARVNLRCTSCGFHFSVTDTQRSKPEGVKCPSCLAPVGIDGPVEGGSGRKPVRALESARDSGASQLKLWIGVGAGVLLLGIVAVVVLTRGSEPPPAPEPAVPPKPAARPAEKKAAAASPKEAPKVGTLTKTPETPNVEAAPTTPPAASAPPPAAPASQAGDPPLPADLLKSLREEFHALKSWHLNLAMPAPERARADKLLAAGRGAAADLEFLQSVMDGPRFRVVKEEAALIRESRARLEKEALENLPVDKVTMNDGRALHGKILEETDTLVRLERKAAGGLNSVLPLPKADIKEVQKNKGIGGDFKTRWETSKQGGPAALLGLLAWCKENSLALQASLVACAILVDDPGRGEARQEAQLAADPVARMLEAEKQGGFIPYEGRRWVPSELRDKLLRNNYTLVDGRWMSPKDVSFSVPSLFRYESQNEKPVQIAGPLAQEEATTFNIVQGQEKITNTPLRRFYAAGQMSVTGVRTKALRVGDADQVVIDDKGTPAQDAPMRGEVSISVPLKGPMLEGSVKTSADVRPGGAIAVYLVIDGSRQPFYTCDSKEDRLHKLPDLIRGRTQVDLVAVITDKANYRSKSETKRAKGSKKDTGKVIEYGLDVTYKQLIPEYSAMLFPSNANTGDVFQLRGTTAEPAPALDKLFENAREVLKK